MAIARTKPKQKKKKKSITVNGYSRTIGEADNDSLLYQLRNNVNDFYKSYNTHIERARNYLTFLYVDMWDIDVRQARENLSKPTMQFNKLVPILRSILGEQRENSPALAVRALGANIKQDDVDMREGLLRQIAYDSNSDIVYQIASKQALECGWGAARVIIEYENENSFNKCLKVAPVVDFQAAFWDPTAQLPDKSDGDYAGVYEILSLDKFKKLYPDIENPQSVTPVGNNYYVAWNSRDTVMVCELYYKEYYTKTIVQLSDGNVFDEDEAKEILEMQEKSMNDMSFKELHTSGLLKEENRREVKAYKIKHCKFIENAILEETDYPGQILPIVYFVGDSTVIDGERIPLPYVQEGIDAQKMINYIGSEMAFAVLRARKETVAGTPDNFAGYEDEWRNADQVQGPMYYNWDDKAGAPIFQTPPVINPMFAQIYQQCVTDLQQNLGWFDDAQGAQTNAQSGKAINARQTASKKGVNVYTDNWAQGIRQIGKIQLELFPHVYDTEREVTIMGKDGNSKTITINKENGFKMQPDGSIVQDVANDMSFGKYDVEIRVDGSYDAQQAEMMDVLIRMATINPAAINLMMDLIAESSGLEKTPQLVERFKTLLPPNILAQEEGKPMPPPQPPQPTPQDQAAMMKSQAVMSTNNVKMAELNHDIKNDDQKNQLAAQQQVLDQQRNMIDAKNAGLEHIATLSKSAVELHRANADKDIAILDHATEVHKASTQKNSTNP